MKKHFLICLVVFVAIGAVSYIAIPDIQGPLKQYFPFIFALACPLMMLFGMHGGHGDHEEKIARTTTRPVRESRHVIRSRMSNN